MTDPKLEPFEAVKGQSFLTHVSWVNQASRRLTSHPEYNNTEHGDTKKGWRGHHFTAMCFDQLGRRCRNGADMARARDEDAFPVWWVWPDQIVGLLMDRRATPQPDAATTIERLRAELDKAKWRYQWCANELLGCDYGDNETGQMGWLVYGWRDKSGQRRIYGASIDEAVDAQIALSRIDTKGGE